MSKSTRSNTIQSSRQVRHIVRNVNKFEQLSDSAASDSQALTDLRNILRQGIPDDADAPVHGAVGAKQRPGIEMSSPPLMQQTPKSSVSVTPKVVDATPKNTATDNDDTIVSTPRSALDDPMQPMLKEIESCLKTIESNAKHVTYLGIQKAQLSAVLGVRNRMKKMLKLTSEHVCSVSNDAPKPLLQDAETNTIDAPKTCSQDAQTETEVIAIGMCIKEEMTKVNERLDALTELQKPSQLTIEDIKRAVREILSSEHSHDAPAPKAQVAIIRQKNKSKDVVNTKSYSFVVTSVRPEIIDIKSAIIKNVRPQDLKVGVKKFRNIKDAQVVVECDTAKQATILRQAIEESDETLKTSDAQKKRPSMILANIDADAPNNEVIESIINQNIAVAKFMEDKTPSEFITFRFAKKSKDPKFKHIIISVDPSLRPILKHARKLNVGFQQVSCEDYSPVIRCYKCLRYGHTTKYCTNAQVCFHCGEDHQKSDCPAKTANTPAVCSNCTEHNNRRPNTPKHHLNVVHSVTSKDCPTYARYAKAAYARVDYGPNDVFVRPSS